MDNIKRMHKYIHLQLGFTKFNTVVRERNLEELVLSNKDDVIVPCWVEFACGVRWLGGVT